MGELRNSLLILLTISTVLLVSSGSVCRCPLILE